MWLRSALESSLCTPAGKLHCSNDFDQWEFETAHNGSQSSGGKLLLLLLVPLVLHERAQARENGAAR